jgi:protein-L-isoaspartate(D-aspartate) O-methyltransferase
LLSQLPLAYCVQHVYIFSLQITLLLCSENGKIGITSFAPNQLQEVVMAIFNSVTRSPSRTMSFTNSTVDFADPIEKDYGKERQHMVDQHIKARGITEPRVLNALLTVPRHRFIPRNGVHLAYQDEPLPISHNQTISQPYIVAFMSEAAMIPANGKVLEIGTGSGYQTAILGMLAETVYSVEIIPSLAKQAEQTLQDLGYKNIHIKQGNGYQGWSEQAPYDAIVVSAAPTRVPSALVDQLALGGKLVVPVGHSSQTILVITRHVTGLETEYTIPVKFVPMVGDAG